MTGINKRFFSGASIVLILAASPAWAQTTAEPLTRDEVAAIGHLVVKAAHFTGQEPRLVRYEVTNPKQYRATYILTMEYYGRFSGRRYVAAIDVHMDTLGHNEAMRVDYSDNNPFFGASASKLARVVHQINNVIGVP
jgi:hypothetical protein